MLLDTALLATLDGLTLADRRPRRGSAPGPRRSQALGNSVEFREFREYNPGDDFRRVDWNAFARLDRLFLRQYAAEENAMVTLVLDISASMYAGSPAKIDLARGLCGALAYIALRSDDRVAVALLEDRVRAVLAPRSGRNRSLEIWRFLEGATHSTPARHTDLGVGLRGVAANLRATVGATTTAGGMTLIITDLLTPSDWRSGLRGLLAARQDVTLLQVLSPDEMDPPLRGDLALVDSETGERREISLTPALVKAYRQRLAAYQEDIATFCRAHNVTYVSLVSSTSLSEVMLRTLRRAGIVQ